MRKEVVLADNASWLFRIIPYLDLRRHLGRGVAGADLPHRPAVLLVGRPDRHHRAARQRALFPRAGRHGRRHELRRHRLEPRGDDRLARRTGHDHDRVHAGADRRFDPAFHAWPTSWLSPHVGLRVSLGLALVALIMVAIAENGRIPVDNPATHLELTMVHEAMVLEYSGRHLALIELAASLKLLLYVSLIACLFAPWGIERRAARHRALAIGIARLCRQARRRRLPAGVVRDVDRQDARVPRAGIPRRGADARPAWRRCCASCRGASDDAESISTSPICWPARWCWSASSSSIRTGCMRCSTSMPRTPWCWRLSVAWQAFIQDAPHLYVTAVDRAGLQGHRHPGRAASDDRAARHSSRDREGGRRRPRHARRHGPRRAVDGGDAAGDRGRRSAGARGSRLRARPSCCSAC